MFIFTSSQESDEASPLARWTTQISFPERRLGRITDKHHTRCISVSVCWVNLRSKIQLSAVPTTSSSNPNASRTTCSTATRSRHTLACFLCCSESGSRPTEMCHIRDSCELVLEMSLLILGFCTHIFATSPHEIHSGSHHKLMDKHVHASTHAPTVETSTISSLSSEERGLDGRVWGPSSVNESEIGRSLYASG